VTNPVANIISLQHSKATLALHLLREGWGRPLLLLHGLGERTPATAPEQVGSWAGPIYGLDFTGHGHSTVPDGGGYTAEVLMGDVDVCLTHLGRVTVLGRGLGAYVAMLIAGARPTEIRGAILADGPGLVGGGIRPGSPHVVALEAPPGGPRVPDPYALSELSRDVRPPDYAVEFVRQMMQWSELDAPLAVTTVVRPEWLAAVAAEPGIIETTVPDALERFAAIE
jgi:pimeloyl-ACP methyl ester carboxylesterase